MLEDSPIYLLPFEEIPSEIKNRFDDWGQSIPISIEVICDEADLAGTIIDISMEPLELEYEGVDEYTYTPSPSNSTTRPIGVQLQRVELSPTIL